MGMHPGNGFHVANILCFNPMRPFLIWPLGRHSRSTFKGELQRRHTSTRRTLETYSGWHCQRDHEGYESHSSAKLCITSGGSEASGRNIVDPHESLQLNLLRQVSLQAFLLYGSAMQEFSYARLQNI